MKKSLYQQFKAEGFNFFIGVPCSGLKDFIKEAQDDRDNIYIPVPREDTAVAIAVGSYFTGKKPLVFMQNSGLGNVVNITTSLLQPYRIPIHFLISVRKKPFEHEFMYKITKKLIKVLGWYNNIFLIEAKDD